MRRRGGSINTKRADYIDFSRNASGSLDKIAQNIVSAMQTLGDDARQALVEEGEAIKIRSDNLAPKDSNELVDSSYIVSDYRNPNVFQVEIGYTAPHALFQHELYGDSYENPTTPGTQPKFLQTALTEVEGDLAEMIASKMKV